MLLPLPSGPDTRISPWGLLQDCGEAVEVLRGETELLQTEGVCAEIRQVENQIFTVDARDRGNEHADLPVAHPLDKTAFLGDSTHAAVDVGEVLDPGNHGQGHGFRQIGQVMRLAVYPETDTDVLCLGADVNVRRPVAYRLCK